MKVSAFLLLFTKFSISSKSAKPEFSIPPTTLSLKLSVVSCKNPLRIISSSLGVYSLSSWAKKAISTCTYLTSEISKKSALICLKSTLIMVLKVQLRYFSMLVVPEGIFSTIFVCLARRIFVQQLESSKFLFFGIFTFVNWLGF